MADAEGAAVAPRGASAYDGVAQAVHWFVAVLVVCVVLLGWTIDPPRRVIERMLPMRRSA
jgi:cytochrome b561